MSALKNETKSIYPKLRLAIHEEQPGLAPSPPRSLTNLTSLINELIVQGYVPLLPMEQTIFLYSHSARGDDNSQFNTYQDKILDFIKKYCGDTKWLSNPNNRELMTATIQYSAIFMSYFDFLALKLYNIVYARSHFFAQQVLENIQIHAANNTELVKTIIGNDDVRGLALIQTKLANFDWRRLEWTGNNRVYSFNPDKTYDIQPNSPLLYNALNEDAVMTAQLGKFKGAMVSALNAKNPN